MSQADFNRSIGKKITKKDANAYFLKALDIEKRSKNRLKNEFEKGDKDPEALFYYADNKMGYVFSFDILKEIFEKMQTHGKNGYLVLMEGAREHKESGVSHQGKSTMIAMVYKLENNILKLDPIKIESKNRLSNAPEEHHNNGLNKINILELVGDDDIIGSEHPGTIPPGDTTTKLPEEININDIGLNKVRLPKTDLI